MGRRRTAASNKCVRGTSSPSPDTLACKQPQSAMDGHIVMKLVTLLAILSVGVSVGFLQCIYPRLAKSLRPDLLPPTGDESSKANTGGWRLPDEATLAAYDTGICNIDRRSAEELSPAQFEAEYHFKKPVILKFKNGARNWTKPEMWTRQRLKADYGHWSLQTGKSMELVRSGGRGEQESSFAEYVDSLMNDVDQRGERRYVFDKYFYEKSDLPKSLSIPPYLPVQELNDEDVSTFFLGASGSGVSFHKHGDAWAGVVYGRKLWFLYPSEKHPRGGMYPGFTQLDWYRRLYPELNEKDKPMECVQEAGDILYVPEGFYHGTINLGDTIGVAMRRGFPTLPVEKLIYEGHQLTQEAAKHANPETFRKYLRTRKELLHLQPDNAQVRLEFGAELMYMGEMTMALKYTEEAIALDKYFIQADLLRAKILIQLERKKKAEEIYVDIIKNRNPRRWEGHHQYYLFLVAEKRYREAVKILEKVAELRPDVLRFAMELKAIQEAIGETAAAAKTQQRINELKDK